jgi:hypothetical protein
MFENRVLSRIFCSKREKIGGGCRKLCSEEFDNLYFSQIIIIIIIINLFFLQCLTLIRL